METLEKYRQIVKELLTDHTSNNEPEIECQIICDTEHESLSPCRYWLEELAPYLRLLHPY